MGTDQMNQHECLYVPVHCNFTVSLLFSISQNKSDWLNSWSRYKTDHWFQLFNMINLVFKKKKLKKKREITSDWNLAMAKIIQTRCSVALQAPAERSKRILCKENLWRSKFEILLHVTYHHLLQTVQKKNVSVLVIKVWRWVFSFFWHLNAIKCNLF